MLGIGRAENRSFQPVASLVRVKEFPPFSRSSPGLAATLVLGQESVLTLAMVRYDQPSARKPAVARNDSAAIPLLRCFRSPAPVPKASGEARPSKCRWFSIRFPSRKTERLQSARFVSVGSQKNVRRRADGQMGGCRRRIRTDLRGRIRHLEKFSGIGATRLCLPQGQFQLLILRNRSSPVDPPVSAGTRTLFFIAPAAHPC